MPLQPVRATYRNAPRLSAQTRTHQYAILPAPIKGLDATQPLVAQDPRAANILDNFTVRRSGIELRPGWKRWVTNLGGAGALANKVVSLMTYFHPNPALSKIFAACDDGNIYDVTAAQAEGFVPPVMVAIPGQISPGQFSWTNFSTTAINYLCICAAGGGYWTYDAAGGWVNRTPTINPAPAAAAAPNWDFVMVWKNRLWFIQNATQDAWYLATNAITGTAANFDFGPLFVHGGQLEAMASYTVDAGDGIDDKLIIAGSGGDLLIYEGTDPSAAATFRIAGRWYVGKPPAGRRWMSKYGGDLAMVTPQGIEFVSRLMQGRSALDPEGLGDDAATRYNEVIGAEVRATDGQSFWNLTYFPEEQFMLVTTPYNNAQASHQHVFSVIPRAWSRFLAIPMVCAETLNGALYFGTLDGKVGKLFAAPTDDELSTGAPGVSVQGRAQTSFVAPGNDLMALKRPLLVMPMFIAVDTPQVKLQINTEWSASAPPGTPAYVPTVQAMWDVAKWDQALWTGGAFTFTGWVGVLGLGVYMSLSFTLTGSARTLFTSWKIVFEPGGIA
jgi:hypothetical protein